MSFILSKLFQQLLTNIKYLLNILYIIVIMIYPILYTIVWS